MPTDPVPPIRIDPEFQSYLRKLREDERQELEQSLLREGCRESLTAWQGVLLDGHHRYAICQQHNISFQVESVDLPDRAAAIDWIMRTQLGRRNLTADEYRYYIGKLYEREKQPHGGNRKSKSENQTLIGDTAQRVASEHGVSRDTIHRAATFARDVDTLAEVSGPELRRGILSGESRLTNQDVHALAQEGEGLHFADIKEAEAWLTERRSRQAEARRRARQEKFSQVATNPEIPQEKKFAILLADPPWHYEYVETESRAVENQYPTMTLEEICSLPVSQLAAADSILFLWTTSPKLEESFDVLKEWGFQYRTCLVWAKDKIGMGYYARQQHELLLIAKKGTPPMPEPEDRPASVIHAPRTKHSVKPDVFYEIIERMYPRTSKIELFARRKRKSWEAWGNQVEDKKAESQV